MKVKIIKGEEWVRVKDVNIYFDRLSLNIQKQFPLTALELIEQGIRK